jgi:hypothetical protein
MNYARREQQLQKEWGIKIEGLTRARTVSSLTTI